MPLILPGNVGSATAATGYDVANSVRLNGNAYMHKTQSGGNRQIFTMSCWTKLTGGYGGNGGSLLSTDGLDDDSNFHFTVTSDKCLVTSVVVGVCSLKCHVDKHTVAAGSFKVSITNKSGGTLADDSTMVINYVIL